MSKVKADLELYCQEYYEKLIRARISLQRCPKVAQYELHRVCPELKAYLILVSLTAMSKADAIVASLALHDTCTMGAKLHAFLKNDHTIFSNADGRCPFYAVIFVEI